MTLNFSVCNVQCFDLFQYNFAKKSDKQTNRNPIDDKLFWREVSDIKIDEVINEEQQGNTYLSLKEVLLNN